MKSYKYLSIYENAVVLKSSDPEILKWILDEVKKLVPRCQTRNEVSNSEGELYAFTIHQLKGQDQWIAYCILQKLCEQGWEPFAVSSYVANSRTEGDFIHLRLEI